MKKPKKKSRNEIDRLTNALKRQTLLEKKKVLPEITVEVASEEVLEGDVIYLSPVRDPETKELTGIIAQCTCKEWFYGPSQSMTELANESVKHRDETGHQLRRHE